MARIRQPAVAGMFYPHQAAALQEMVHGFLAEVDPAGPLPKAIIAPHAGFVYSGPIAATAYRRVAGGAAQITRVVLIGPSHRVPFRGLAVSSADSFHTPLGDVPIDRRAVEGIIAMPQVRALDDAHSEEHSLEVHLPFLQVVLNDFAIVPLVVGDATYDDVAEVIEYLWGGPETLIVVSSDLSHYHNYETARKMDKATSEAIEKLCPEEIEYDQACGRTPICGLLQVVRKRGLTAKTIDLRNSGDTSAMRNQVVGYGAYVFN